MAADTKAIIFQCTDMESVVLLSIYVQIQTLQFSIDVQTGVSALLTKFLSILPRKFYICNRHFL